MTARARVRASVGAMVERSLRVRVAVLAMLGYALIGAGLAHPSGPLLALMVGGMGALSVAGLGAAWLLRRRRFVTT